MNIGQILRLTGFLDQERIEELLQELRGYTTQPPVLIRSLGGTITFFPQLANIIESRGLTTVADDVSGSAITLFLLGRQRLVFPDSKFRFVEICGVIDIDGGHRIVTFDEMEAYAEILADELEPGEYERWKVAANAAQRWYLQFLEDRVGVPASRVQDMMEQRVILTAREAVQYGFAHEIIPRSAVALYSA